MARLVQAEGEVPALPRAKANQPQVVQCCLVQEGQQRTVSKDHFA
jgi:hypothetical protein